MEKNFELTHLKCYACNLKSHFIMNCPRLHYQPDHSFLILKHLYSVSIEQRTPFNERRRRKINARGSLAYSLVKIVRFNFDFDNQYSNSIEPNEEVIEEKGQESLFFEATKEISITDLSGGGGRKKEASIDLLFVLCFLKFIRPFFSFT